MFKIHIKRTLDKPIDEVFEALSDHARYQEFAGIKASTLVEQGNEEKNGVGALRIIDAGNLVMTERITHFERPVRMNYLIEASKPFFIAHDIGEIRLQADGDKTHVEWISEGRITTPLIGRFLDKMFDKQGPRAFHSILKGIEKRAA